MKKAGIIIASVLGVLLLAAWIIPTFFRDEIMARLQREINSRVSARVLFRPEAVNLSLFHHFPSLTLKTDTLTIIGQSPFRGDTLIHTPSLEVSVNLASVLSGDNLKINGFYLNNPRILIKLLRDGRANYDIYKATESNQPAADTSRSTFRMDVREWAINDGTIRYEDQSIPLAVRLQDVNHTGSGSLSADVSDLTLNTQAERLTVTYAGTEYLTDKKLDADMRLGVNLPQSIYTFTNNRIRLNDLPLELNGAISLPDTSVRFDLTYRTPDSDFKNLLSLVPGIYSQRFKDLDASGTVRFDGNVKGVYNGRQTPAFVLNLLVNNGRFKYANLPSSVDNIAVDMTVSNQTDQLDNTLVNLKKLVANLGSNPVRGRVLFQGLTHSQVDADVTAKINLQELTQLFPIDSLTLRGLYDLNVKAKGIYDQAAKRFPVVNAAMKLQNGYAKSLKFPEPLEDINAVAAVTNRTGQLADTHVDIDDLRLRLAGEPFQVKGWVQNLDDYTYNLAAKGKLDLTKITRIFPLEGTQLAGLIDADIHTQGRLSDAKAKRYDRLPTSGTLQISNLKYRGDALPQGLTLNSARMTLAPQKLSVQQAQGVLGTSAFSATGSLSNYIPFLLEDTQPLEGNLSVQADRFNVNEWMTDEPQAKPQTKATSVIEIPKNIRFLMDARVGRALYDEMPLDDIKGQIEVADGAVRMKQVTFNSLGGQFVTNGLYDSKNTTKPRFAFDVNINNAEVSEAYQHLKLTQIVFPLAQYIFGKFSSKFAVNGLLEPDMMPNLNSLTGNALVEVVQATLKNNPLVEMIVQRTHLDELRNTQFKDLLMSVTVKDGLVAIRPFDVKIKDYVASVSGTNSLEGGLNYTLKLDVPTGKAGSSFAKTFTSLTGQPLTGVDRAKLDFALGGTYKKPQVRFLASSTANQLKETLVQQVLKKPLEQVREKAVVRADSLRVQLDQRRKEAEQRVKDEVKQQGLKFLQRLANPKRNDST